MDKRTIIFVILMTTTFFVINHFLFPSKHPVSTEAVVTSAETIAPVPASVLNTDEKFYVIENGYQQLVISSINGALAEINLPLHSQDDPQSVVRKIGIDKTDVFDFSKVK